MDYYFGNETGENRNRDSFITSNFEEPVLLSPARTDNKKPCNSLKIITAFTDCERISTHMISLSEGMKHHRMAGNIKVDIMLGMTKSSLTQKKHEDICRLIRFLKDTKEMPMVTCRYICNGPEVHSKVYLWSYSDKQEGIIPYSAYCGSLNYTMNAFYKRRESVCKCEPFEAYNYYNELIPDTIDCFDPDVSEKIRNVINNSQNAAEDPDNSDTNYEMYDQQKPVAEINVSLLQANGEGTGYGSGINWGIRPNGTKRNPNQAYIPYNRKDRIAGFFPDRIHPSDENCPVFRVITKDFGEFHMRMAQQGNKALQSVESNAILGEWIRKKIGTASGGLVTKQMLDNYGKTYVTFRKYEDGTYLLDF